MTLVTRDVETLARAWHSAYEWQYGDCDHGTYSGGPSHGEPYAMCEIQARRLIDSGAVTPLADAVEALAEDRDKVRRLHDAYLRNLDAKHALRKLAAALRGGTR